MIGPDKLNKFIVPKIYIHKTTHGISKESGNGYSFLDCTQKFKENMFSNVFPKFPLFAQSLYVF